MASVTVVKVVGCALLLSLNVFGLVQGWRPSTYCKSIATRKRECDIDEL
jgi:hypothetical protein